MSTPWKKYAFGLVTFLGCTPALWAQVGGAPPGAVPTPPVLAAPAPAPAAPGNLWSFLCPTAEQKAACREKFCRCAIGKLAGGMLQPVSAFSGGLINNPCALPTAKDLAKPADSADGAAARIKADEMAAKERREAVRYLGTVECNRWPEAEAALINSLRGDRNECVRLEAAWVLGRGCCCTPKIVAALSLTVSGSDRDGFPVERSERVRAAASASLNHCLACLAPQVPVPMGAPPVQEKTNGEKKEVPLPGKELPLPQTLTPAAHNTTAAANPAKVTTPEMKQASFYSQVQYKDVAPLVQNAKNTAQRPVPAVSTAANPRHGGLFAIVGTAFSPTTSAQGQEVVQVSASDMPPAYGTAVPVAPTYANGSPALSPYSAGTIIPESQGTFRAGTQPSPNRGLLPAMWNLNQSRNSVPTSTEMVSPQVILGEPMTVGIVQPVPVGNPGQNTAVIPVTMAPTVRDTTAPPPVTPVRGPGTDFAPRPIDQILAGTGH